MTSKFLVPGLSASITKTVGESDVYLFAGITGDLSPNHVDEETMRATRYGGRIAHGALIVGFMSAASTRMIESHADRLPHGELPVSLGYDRIRFLKGVRIGDTITVHYSIAEADPAARRTKSDIRVTDQHGDPVAVATHVMKWLPAPD